MKRLIFVNNIQSYFSKGCPPLTDFGVYLRWANENVTDLLKI